MKRTNTNKKGVSTPRTISIVGSGNVGTHLALAFKAAGCTIQQILSRNFDHAQQLALRVGAQPTDKAAQLQEADVCLLCVGDDAIYDLALDLELRKTLVLHTSGTTPASVLKHISKRYGVLWSPQTFVRDIAMDYSRLPFCIEGSTPEVEAEIEDLARKVSNHVYHLDGEQRRHAHLASVMVSNFVNAINATAQSYMQAHNMDFEMLRTLAEQTLEKWDYGDLWAQQTGPARRRDDKTLDAQRRLLADNKELLALYDMLTDTIQQHS